MITNRHAKQAQHPALNTIATGLYLLGGLIFSTSIVALASANTGTPPGNSTIEREATDAFNHANYDRVLKLWQSIPPQGTPSNPLIRLAFHSSLKLGRPEEAFTLYQRLVPTDRQDDPTLLRPLALSFVTSHVRDSQEYVRIAWPI